MIVEQPNRRPIPRLRAVAPAAGAASATDQRRTRALHGGEPLGDQSDERRVTRYARAAARAVVRRLPSSSAPNVWRMRYLTDDGPVEFYAGRAKEHRR
ncbi:MAG: hypothetical protein M3N47_07885 [Chloroflexota bacterium]|nr:hypothetical protein [Chloroflexota bacterium]